MIRETVVHELKELHDRYFKHFTIEKDEYEAEVKRLRFKYVVDYDREN
jgi:hypothetical protein|tara:strand:+ start:282 stop:425 length:144 start_codon:yes stop_codon:yes gene_type:complete